MSSGSPQILLALFTLAWAACVDDAAPRRPEMREDTVSLELHEGTALYFDVSPDGTAIVIDLAGQLWEVPAEGGRARPLTDGARESAEDRQPSFSPDGRWVATRSDRPAGRGIWIHGRSGGERRQLSDSALMLGGDDGVPVWLPDGRRLVYHHRGSIVETDVDSGTTRALELDSLDNRLLDEPFASPDGRRLVVTGPWPSGSARALLEGPPGAAIWEIDLPSHAVRRLTAEGVEARAPAYDPEGRRIAYFVGVHDSHQLVVRGPDGATSVVSAEPDIEPRRVRWSGDGRALYFVAAGRLRRVAAGGGKSRVIPIVAELDVRRATYARAPLHVPDPGERLSARGFGGLSLAPEGARAAVLALGRLWIVDLQGVAVAAAVAAVPVSAATLHWSPDGRNVLWSDGVHGQDDLWVTDVEAGVSRRITSLPGVEEPVGWSPSGEWIAFVHEGRLRILPADADRNTSSRDVAPVRWSETGAFGSPYAWLAAADTLLTYGMDAWPVASGACARAELVALDGSIVPLQDFPCRPGHAVTATDGSLVSIEHGLLTRHARSEGGWDTGRPIGETPALNPSVARTGAVLYVGPDGLHLTGPEGGDRSLGWPIDFEAPASPPLLVRNVRIVPLDGARTGRSDLLIVDGRIHEIGPAGSLSLPSGVDGELVDGGGMWLTPGLIDTHVHFVDTDVDVLRDALRHGVTTVRDMWDRLGVAAAFRDAVDAGVLAGARVVVSGPPFYPSPTAEAVTTDFLWLVADSVEMDRGLAMLAGMGAGHVKMRYVQSWQGGAQLVRLAHARGLPVSGHCAHGLPVLLAGIDGLEHADGQCGDWEFGIREDLVQLLGSFGVTVAPTMYVHAAAARELESRPSSALRATLVARAERARSHARRLAEGGVDVVAGSDAQDRPGALHGEIERLVAAGLSTRAALLAATRGAAESVGLGSDLGRIRVGYVADLLLLEANPLADVRNTARIHMVIHGGRIVTP